VTTVFGVILAIVILAFVFAVFVGALFAAYKLLTAGSLVLLALPAHLRVPMPMTPSQHFEERYGPVVDLRGRA
jgi:hypothetical protein